VTTETTDNNGVAITPKQRGRVFYDATCPLCRQSLERLGPIFRRRGFAFVTLQESWVAADLGLTAIELRREMKLQLADGRVVGGVDAWIELGRAVWWLAPGAALLKLPGIGALARAGYRWLARNRHCLSGICGLEMPVGHRPHHAATTFLELP
jgi:predicted DCC family thiol-disulfide oxidoreductase YuxK